MFKLGAFVVCYMINFATLPATIEGPVVLNLKDYVTIAVQNKDNTEKVEMTFKKNKCKNVNINRSVCKKMYRDCLYPVLFGEVPAGVMDNWRKPKLVCDNKYRQCLRNIKKEKK